MPAPQRRGCRSGPRPHGLPKRASIFSESTISSRAISLARITLNEDEYALPNVSATRVLFVTADQRVWVGDEVKQMNYTIPDRGNGEANYLLRAKRTATVQIPGIGQVRLLDVNP